MTGLKSITAGLLFLFVPPTCGFGGEPDTRPAERPVADRAEDVQPLETGDRAAAVDVRTPQGKVVSLGEKYAEAPTVLVFYRGGWCPYCNVQLSAVAEAESRLAELGFQVLAISPDRPEKLRDTLEEKKFGYQLLSDSDMAASGAFGLAYRVDEELVDQYRNFDMDLEEASGEDHHLLPVPAVYVIDEQGTIRFAHWDPDYKKRLDADKLLTAARSVVDSGAEK